MWVFKRKKRILIIEDDNATRQLTMRRMEKTNDYIPLEAESIEEAIGIIKSEKPDYLILDVILGGESGLDLLRMMRAEKVPHIPTLITSSDQRLGSIEDALDFGILGYVVKPYSTYDIVSKLS